MSRNGRNKCYLSVRKMERLVAKAEQLSSWLKSMEKTFCVMDPNALSCIRRVVEYIVLHIRLAFVPFREPLNQVMDILVKLRRRSSDEAYKNVLDALLGPFMVIIGECEGQWVTIRTILRCFTLIMQSLPKVVTSEIVLKHIMRIANIRRSLKSSGEFRNQRVVMLFLFECVHGMSRTDKAQFVQIIFPHDGILHFRRCFLVAKRENLEKGIRECLNEYNDMLVRREIISFAVREMFLGAIKCSGFQGEEIWIDFNSFPLNISIYCSSKGIIDTAEEKLMLIYIPVKIISGFSLDRNNFDEELFVMATEDFTVVDVLSGDVKNSFGIRDLQCSFFMPERNRDEGNATLEKLRCIVAERNHSMRRPLMDRTNCPSSLESVKITPKKVSQDQCRVISEPMNFSPRTISPILTEPHVNDSEVFTEHEKSARKQEEEEKEDAEECSNDCEGSDFRGFCAIEESSSEDEKVVEPPRQATPPPVKVKAVKKPKKKVNSPKGRIKRGAPRKTKTSREPKKRAPAPRKSVKRRLEASEVPQVDKFVSISSDEEAVKWNELPNEETDTHHTSFLDFFTKTMTPKKEDNVQKCEEEDLPVKVQKSLCGKEKAKHGKRKSSVDVILSSSDEEIPKKPKQVKRIDLNEIQEASAVDYDMLNFSPVAQTQRKPEILEEVAKSWSPKKTAEKKCDREEQDDDDGLMSSSDDEILKKSTKHNRSFVVSSDEETTKVMQIVRAVVHQENENITPYQVSSQELPEPHSVEENPDNDFFNLSSLSQVKAKESPVAEEIKKSESGFTAPDKKRPPARKRGIWLDKPIWKRAAPTKIKEPKEPEIKDDMDIFEFDDSESSIPDISKAIDKFLNKDDNKENAENPPKTTDQLKSEKPTKRTLFNPDKIVEKPPGASPEKSPKYKFFKSRNSTPSDIVIIDSELSDDSDKERLALAKRKKVEQHMDKINKKVKKEEKPQSTKKRAPKKSLARTPIVKRSIKGTNIQAGVFMANITPSSSSVFMKTLEISNTTVTM